jgi:hypothetical protein
VGDKASLAPKVSGLFKLNIALNIEKAVVALVISY